MILIKLFEEAYREFLRFKLSDLPDLSSSGYVICALSFIVLFSVHFPVFFVTIKMLRTNQKFSCMPKV